MTTPERKVDSFQVFKIIWGALLISQFMYAFVLFKVVLADAPPATYRWFPSFGDAFETALSLAAVVAGALAFVVPPFLARLGKSRREVLAENGETETKQDQFRYFAAFIVRLAFAESICLFGFVLAMHVRNPGLIAPFLAVSVILYLKNFPSDPAKVRADLGA